MQYDVQGSGPRTSEPAGSASAAGKPPSGLGARFGRRGGRSAAPVPSESSPPPLRDRLREVLERDRALIEAHRPLEAARQVRELLHEAPAAEPEAKSGTHARVPVPAGPQPRAAAPEAVDPALFAAWIEEEITEAQGISAAPVVFESSGSWAPVTSTDEELDLLLQEVSEIEGEVTRRGPPPAGLTVEAEETRRGPPPTGPTPRQHSAPATGIQEPIATRTMARLLATHGYHVRALAIYDILIARDPYNEELWAEAELLRG